MASRKRRRVAALALVSAAWWLMALFAGGDDARAAGWLPAVNVTPASATYSSPRLAMDDRGDLFATWVDTDGASAGHVQVSKRPVGGSWEDPETLDAKVDADFAAPDIAVDAAGNAVVVYSQDGATIRQARRLAGDSAFGDESPVPLGVAGPTNDFPRVAVNRRGDAVLAWRGFQMANPGVKVTVGSVTAPFGAPQQAYAPNTQPVSPPDVDINEAGDAAATWQTTPGSSVAIVAAYRPHGGTFQTTPDTLEGTSSVGLSDPEVAVDSQGRAVALFVRSAGDRIGARSRAAGVGTPWAVLPNPEVDVLGTGFLEVAFDAQDSAVAAWSGLSQVRVATRPAGGVFDSPPPDTLTDDQEVASSLAVDSSVLGTIALAWQRNASNTIRAAIRPPGGPFGAVATLTGPGRFGNAPDTAADQTGNAAAVWTDTDSAQGDPRIASAVYDATPPQIANVQVPPVANAGTPVAMAVDANDDWSTPAVVWDFGDETAPPGSGIQVNHTYASPGTYKVTITAVDSVGNVATTSRDIVVGTGEVVDPPTRGVDFNASQVSGTVLVSVPKNAPAERVLARPPVAHGAAAIRPPRGYKPFRRLGENDNIPVGAILDASRGTTALSMAVDKAGKLQRGSFRAGVFKTKQSKKSALTTLTTLGGGNFKKGCKGGRIRKSGVGEARRRPRRRLFSSARGRFRTRGRHSSATVRGTKWSMTDTCAGTRTAVSSGKVTVRDLVKHRTVLVRRGHHYLARPKKRR